MNDPIQSLIRAYTDGSITPPQFEQLQQALREDAAVREQFLHELNVHAALDDLATGTDNGKSSRDELEIADVDESQDTQRDTTRRWLRWFPSRLAVAATVLIAVGVLSFFAGRGNWNAETATPSPRTVEGVARLVSTVDAQWQTTEPLPDKSLDLGEYQLVAGTVELEFREGARVTLRGPARFSLRSSNHLHLTTGNLVANVPEEALGFTVTTPQSKVVDLGTAFGLAVDKTGRTDIHVLDGLVQAFPRQATEGVMISQGEARRIDPADDSKPLTIPVASRDALLDNVKLDGLGVELLRGVVRLCDRLSTIDLQKRPAGQHWIDVIPEKRGVTLARPITVSIDSAGVYRRFNTSRRTIPAGARVNSYLFHFRSENYERVHGVVRFAQPIVGVVCVRDGLRATDQSLGLPRVNYKVKAGRWRGLESSDQDHYVEGHKYMDEVTLSQDRRTLSLRINANPSGGVDQVRVLTLSDE